MSTTDSNVVEVLSDMENVESSSKSISNCATQDEGLSLDSDFVQYSMKEQESSSLEINTDKESESCQVKADELIIASFAAANECEVEELEGSCTNDQMTEKFCSESTTKANEHASKPKGTPLNHKSLRKLKIMLKEKLQTTTLLTSKMEKLRLEENEAPIDIRYPDVEAVPEECDGIETSCGLSTIVSGIAEAPVPAVDTGNDDLDEESKQRKIDKTVNNDPVVDAAQVEGNDEGEKKTTEVVIPLQEVDIIESDTYLQYTPTKSLRKRASKCSSKTRMSSGRKNDEVDMISNKENIDKTVIFGSGKLLSPMSMRSLQNELQQQSEKKRQALQSRSENQCPLSSP